MKKPIVILISSLLAMTAAAADGDTFEAGERGHVYSYTVISEADRTCMTTPGTDEDNPGNSSATLDRTKITIPEKVTYNGKEYTVVEIGNYGFASSSANSSITEFSLPETITRIGDYAFYDRRNITTMNIPSALIYIGENAFNYCQWWKTDLILPETLTEIGKYAFYMCEGVKSIHVPGSVKKIGDSAFSGCYAATSATLGEGVETIGTYAFRDCSNLTSIDLPEGVKTIGQNAFYDCYRLTAVNFPSTVEIIGAGAFQMDYGHTYSITAVTVKATTPPGIHGSTFGEETFATAVLTVPDESVLAYQSDAVWRKFGNIATLSGNDPEPLALEIQAEASELAHGQDMALGVDLPLAWISSNTNVATVDADGTVTPKREGKADITAFVPGYSDLSVTHSVTVTRGSDGLLHIHKTANE